MLSVWSCCLSPLSGQKDFTKFWRCMNIWHSWFRKETADHLQKQSNFFFYLSLFSLTVQKWGVDTMNNDEGVRKVCVPRKVKLLSKGVGCKSKNQWESGFGISSEAVSVHWQQTSVCAKTCALFPCPFGAVLALSVGINEFFSSLSFILISNSLTQLTGHSHLLFLSGHQNYSLRIWHSS